LANRRIVLLPHASEDIIEDVEHFEDGGPYDLVEADHDGLVLEGIEPERDSFDTVIHGVGDGCSLR
jgi:hypothetical protein